MADTPDFHAGPSLRMMAMPCDTNANGDIFGGWLLSLMDLAGSAKAKIRAKSRVTTIGIEAMKFHHPVKVGDEVSCFCEITKIGRTSIQIKVEAWVRNYASGDERQVTEGLFTYVALDNQGQKTPIV
ncbi:MAG: acyl-CoA thioesterase [Alphaproteobacteria bacterium]|jgi:acyl-CoA thioesterase YciA|nr:acyl-CoA thioesterase [Alphaproteobacteria bacterium]MBP9877364.1 acyl-CoA thioesterase [Alphaproteobacteria bacterium]